MPQLLSIAVQTADDSGGPPWSPVVRDNSGGGGKGKSLMAMLFSAGLCNRERTVRSGIIAAACGPPHRDRRLFGRCDGGGGGGDV